MAVSVERRRTLVLIIVALVVAAGAVGYAVFGDRIARDAAVAVSDAPPPAPAEPPASAVAEAAPAEPPVAAPVEASVAEPDPAVTEPGEVAIAAIEPAQAPPVAAPVEPAAPAAPALPVAPQDASFDVVRVEPTGDAVIAGQAPPGATVELLRDGQVHDTVVADATGAFAFVPPPLPPGAHEIALQVREGDAAPRRSPQSVTVVVAEGMDEAPVVALVAPDAPTRILSRPEPETAPETAAPETAAPDAAAPETEVAADASAPIEDEAAATLEPDTAAPANAAAEALPQTQVARADAGGPIADRRGIRVATVEAETGGGLFVSGEGAPNASVRLYLNETFVGRASADYAGLVSFAIRRGVRPGVYRVRLDEVDPRDGAVLSRAEVAFEMPEILAQAEDAPQEAAPPEPAPATEPAPVPGAAPATEAAAAPEAAPEGPAGALAATAPAPEQPAEPVAGEIGTGSEVEVALVEADGVAAEASEREATLTIPEINTALVSRGDSLWRISRRVYGAGVRYTVIFDANQEQIRNPNLIYPGQVFVLPALDAEQPGERAAN